MKFISFIRRLISPAPVPQLEAEHEVYHPGRWSPRTGHSVVIHTGTLASCNEYLAAHQAPGDRQPSKAAIRPTGEMIQSPELLRYLKKKA